MSENLLNKTTDPSLIGNSKEASISDRKINDEIILLSKKIDETIQKNTNLKKRLAVKVDFLKNQYIWEIEDQAAKLVIKIKKNDVALETKLQKIEISNVLKNIEHKKTKELYLLTKKHDSILKELEIQKVIHKKNNTNEYNAKLKEKATAIKMVDEKYVQLMKVASQAYNPEVVKNLIKNHSFNKNALNQAFANLKNDLIKEDQITKSDRERQIQEIEKSYQKVYLTSENLTAKEAKIFEEYNSSRGQSKIISKQLQNEKDALKSHSTKLRIKDIAKLEILNQKFGADLEINRTKKVLASEVRTLSKARLSKINEGIKNNINIYHELADQKMQNDLVPSYHTYKINPLILPNNTYRAHRLNKYYGIFKYGFPLTGVVIGIFLMVLYTLFSFQAAQLAVNSGVEAILSNTNAFGSGPGQDKGTISIIFEANAMHAFTQLYEYWGLSDLGFWNAILAFGILNLMASAMAVTIRKNTLWSYISITTLSTFLIIGIALMITVMVKMDFGQVIFAGAENQSLTMSAFRTLINGIKLGGNKISDNVPIQTGSASVIFGNLFSGLGLTYVDIEAPVINPTFPPLPTSQILFLINKI